MKMKNIISLGALALFSFFAMTACDPQERSDYSLGEAPKPEQLDFTVTPTAEKANVIDFENTSDVPGVATWDLGNNSSTKGNTVTAQYPFAGEYTVVMTLYTTGGSTFITKTVTIAEDDMSLLNTPMYNALTGGATDLDGKTWVFDQYHDGHFGVGPAADATPWWWSCPAEGKTESCLYTQEFTFTQIGVVLEWTNNGNVYTNENGRVALAALGYTNSVVPGDGDFDVEYEPLASYHYSLDETAATLTLSNGAFFGHYAGTSTYKILSLTDDELYVKCASTVEVGNGWWYRLIPKEKNIKPIVIIPLSAVPLAEDFESATSKVTFTKETMGSLTDMFYSNPAPVPVNTSAKACLYQKSGDFYSNIFFTASYNDYVTANAVAGGWISNDKLQKKVAVKLQDSSLGGNAWTTQTEVSFTDLAVDQWIELTFDFSSVSTREDYDKIVVQFGGEGHAGPGIFFFDDFEFGE